MKRLRPGTSKGETNNCSSSKSKWKQDEVSDKINLLMLDDEILVEIICYCNVAEIYILRRINKAFRAFACAAVSRSESLHFSFLKQCILPRYQEACVTLIIKDVRLSNLIRLELEGLLHLTGEGWLRSLFNFAPKLELLNLTGCSRITPEYFGFEDYQWRNSRIGLKYLYLEGCSRVDSETVGLLGKAFSNLNTLRLGGCSQSIDDRSLMILSSWARRLKVIDLCGLKRITDLGWNAATLDMIGPRSCSMVQALQFSSMGSSRIGLPPGALTFLAERSRKLVEVDISGCEQVTDMDINSLAVSSSQTLKCFAARGCGISNASIISIAMYCWKLVELDVSACFDVNTEGIVSLCPSRILRNNRVLVEDDGKGCPELRSLKMAFIPLTDSAITAIDGSLRKLLLLDVSNCGELSAEVLVKLVLGSESLVELDARNTIAPKVVAAAARKRLAIVNQQRCFRQHSNNSASSCTVKYQSQRRKPSLVDPQPMYHCVDCNLTPCWNRGMCSRCATMCHKGHKIFLGSMARFFCDCGFGFSSMDNQCQCLGQDYADEETTHP